MRPPMRRRPYLRAVAISSGAYLDCMLRIETVRLIDEIRLTSQAGTTAPERRRATR